MKRSSTGLVIPFMQISHDDFDYSRDVFFRS